jgi:hypothetical protein
LGNHLSEFWFIVLEATMAYSKVKSETTSFTTVEDRYNSSFLTPIIFGIAEIITKEMAAVRKAFYELNETGTDTSSSLHSRECEGKGCPLCTPIITFIVAQSQHNIRLVPNVQGRTDNVPSGTCVDDCTLMSPMTGSVLAKFDASEVLPDSPVQLFQNADEKRFDFFLIAHG